MNEMSDTTRQFVRAHRTDDVRALMLAQKRWPEVDVRQACVQIAAWQKARTKLPSWAAKDDIVFPEQLSMEQCSSELTARYKAEVWARLSGRRSADVCDLTGGLGVDASMLAQGCRRLTFVEHSEVLCDLARWNLPRMGVGRLDVVCGEAETVLPTLAQQDLIFLDPARRDSHGTRTVALADCSPDLEQLFPLLLDRATWVMAKLSPMLDISDTLRRLGHVAELHVVGVDGECKEVLVAGSRTAATAPSMPVYCVNLLTGRSSRQTFVFTREEEQQSVCGYATAVGRYLYEPNASVLKAGALRCVAERLQVQKLHPNSHLYTSDALVPDFPGRTFEVVGLSDLNKKHTAHLLSGIRKANLTVRNFPLSVAQLRQRLKLSEGGSEYLFATTLADEKHVLIRCWKMKNEK